MENEFLTVIETQKKLRLSRMRAYGLFGEPDFPAVRIGKRLLVRQIDLDTWVNQRRRNVPVSTGAKIFLDTLVISGLLSIHDRVAIVEKGGKFPDEIRLLMEAGTFTKQQAADALRAHCRTRSYWEVETEPETSEKARARE